MPKNPVNVVGVHRSAVSARQRKVGPVSIVLVMLIASIIGIGMQPNLMPALVGAAAHEISGASWTTQVGSISFVNETGENVPARDLSDYLVSAQNPIADEVITNSTSVELQLALTGAAQERRSAEAIAAAEAAEAQRVADAALRAEQARVAAELAERQRIQAEEARIAEEARVAEEARLAEQARVVAEQAEQDRQAAVTGQSAPAESSSIPTRFRNCTHVWEVLGRPIRSGERGFHSGLDRDNDGVGCEQRPH